MDNPLVARPSILKTLSLSLIFSTGHEIYHVSIHSSSSSSSSFSCSFFLFSLPHLVGQCCAPSFHYSLDQNVASPFRDVQHDPKTNQRLPISIRVRAPRGRRWSMNRDESALRSLWRGGSTKRQASRARMGPPTLAILLSRDS